LFCSSGVSVPVGVGESDIGKAEEKIPEDREYEGARSVEPFLCSISRLKRGKMLLGSLVLPTPVEGRGCGKFDMAGVVALVDRGVDGPLLESADPARILPIGDV
jgi:hypothetical protein